MITAIRNFVRFHILGKNPVCSNCGRVMIQTGYPKDFCVYFRCPCCNGKKKVKED